MTEHGRIQPITMRHKYSFINCPGGLSQTIPQVKKLELEVLGWCGYQCVIWAGTCRTFIVPAPICSDQVPLAAWFINCFTVRTVHMLIKVISIKSSGLLVIYPAPQKDHHVKAWWSFCVIIPYPPTQIPDLLSYLDIEVMGRAGGVSNWSWLRSW